MKTAQLELFHIGPPEQLALIPYVNPLAERFDRDFFATIPQLPGVYRMRGEASELLYVGKAKVLRTRVRSYARATPTNSSSKTLRLLQKVRAIEWEETSDERSALLRENALLRTHRPPFNVANTLSHTYAFIHLSDDDADSIGIHLGMTVDRNYPDVYGSFKGISLALRTFRALLRLLWLASNENATASDLPSILMNRRRLPIFSVAHPPDLNPTERRLAYRRLRQFFNGTASSLLREFAEIAKRKNLGEFGRALVAADIETLETFHASHAKRNYRVKREAGFTGHLIPQDTLDELFVLAKHDANAAP
jgi:excinuclease UvrABC nuclease subunit